jgi:hypothetical protein
MPNSGAKRLNLLHVTILAPKILSWISDKKVCTSLNVIMLILKKLGRHFGAN